MTPASLVIAIATGLLLGVIIYFVFYFLLYSFIFWWRYRVITKLPLTIREALIYCFKPTIYSGLIALLIESGGKIVLSIIYPAMDSSSLGYLALLLGIVIMANMLKKKMIYNNIAIELAEKIQNSFKNWLIIITILLGIIILATGLSKIF